MSYLDIVSKNDVIASGFKETLHDYPNLAKAAMADRVTIEDGKYQELPDIDYIKSDALSYSSAKKILVSPIHYVDRRVRPHLYEETDSTALNIGKALHTLLLEPERYEEMIAVLPEGLKKPTKAQLNAKKPSPATEAQINDWLEFSKETENKTVIRPDDLALVLYMCESVMNKKTAQNIIQRGFSEFALFHTIEMDEESKFQIKVKIDKLIIDPVRSTATIVDIKTTTDAGYNKFSRTIGDFGYDIQVAMMDACIKQHYPDYRVRILFVVVEKTPPFGSAFYSLDLDGIDNGYKRLYMAGRLFLRLKESGNFYDYEDHVMPVVMPPWAKV